MRMSYYKKNLSQTIHPSIHVQLNDISQHFFIFFVPVKLKDEIHIKLMLISPYIYQSNTSKGHIIHVS